MMLVVHLTYPPPHPHPILLIGCGDLLLQSSPLSLHNLNPSLASQWHTSEGSRPKKMNYQLLRAVPLKCKASFKRYNCTDKRTLDRGSDNPLSPTPSNVFFSPCSYIKDKAEYRTRNVIALWKKLYSSISEKVYYELRENSCGCEVFKSSLR